MYQQVCFKNTFVSQKSLFLRSRVRSLQTQICRAGSDSTNYNRLAGLRVSTAGICLSVFTIGQILLGPTAKALDIDTVSAGAALQQAKAIPQQQFDKGKIWLLLVGGAAMLLFATIQIENVEFLFPAITSANKAMASYREREKKQLQELEKVKLEEKQMKRIDAAVEAGMRQASLKQQEKIQQEEAQQQVSNSVDGNLNQQPDDQKSEQIRQIEEELERRKRQQQQVS
eukprot:TRINITY_DN2363_c1_g1_i1.p2 TRINITY_DN2363_c1_g1~~TRINITY_DN2363_c1_g1_i1.p2  ORF type:complete len:228 (-),score=29.70 TRINITY_DN2363_c1_g1_i1:223-906(-)